jgi:serine/threonine-protein kinase
VPGKQIGPFQIERELGRGGMGVVYLAHDTKLDRLVAIKSIPPELADDPKARSRFRREAKLLASLNHPDIATIHDIIEGDKGAGYLVLEYIPGDTLADRIARGPLRLDEALSVSEQIAEALAAAHEHGIVHRDLKPANIKITEERRVKVLDFGVAKAAGGEGRDAQSTVTEPGRMIGTPAYMSPEQARGTVVDKRTDIWAFGCCLYESLTGKAAFGAETQSDTVARVLGSEPDWSMLPAATPGTIRVLLHRCLEKDLRRRLQDIGDARIEISDTLERDTSSRGDEAIETRHGRRLLLRRVMLVCLVCLALGAIAAVMALLGLTDRKTPALPARKRVHPEPLPSQTSLLMSRGGSIALSPEGRYLVYVGVDAAGTRRLYLRDMMNDFDPTPIRGTEGAVCPFFRPKGQWIGFFAEDESTAEYALKRVQIQGGTPEFICTVPPLPCGGCWSRDDFIIYSRIYHVSLKKIDAFGEARDYVARVDPNNREHGQAWPDILPEGKGVLYTVWGGDSRRDYRTMIKWRGIDKPQELLPNSSFARYVSTGHIVFLREGSLQAVRFDIDHPGPEAIRGEAQILLEDLGVTAFGSAQFAFSRDEGTLVYVHGATPFGLIEGELVWVSPEEPNAMPIPDSRGYYDEWSQPRLSPDENWIAVTPAYATNVLLYKFGAGYSPPLAVMKGYQGGAVWGPDGEHVAFYSLDADSPPDIYWCLRNSDDAPEPIYKDPNATFPSSFSPDGEYLAFTAQSVLQTNLDQTSDICYRDMARKEVTNMTNTPHCNEWGAAFSPDGKWIAYTSDQMGEHEVYVRQFPKGRPEKIGAGSEVAWGPDKQKLELFYRGGKQFMRAQIQTEPQFKVQQEALFDDVYIQTRFPGYRNYDVSKDGKRFLVIKQVEEPPAPVAQLKVVANWFEELKRLVPTVQD